MSLQSIFIGGIESGGLVQDRKPWLTPDQAFVQLDNAYVWRQRVKKREGLELVGRLRRVLTDTALGNFASAGPGSGSIFIFTQLGITATEPNAQIQPGTLANPLVITWGAPGSQTLTDTTGTGVLVISPVDATKITSATINYATGEIFMVFGGAVGLSAVTITGAYFPGLPVMGIDIREIPSINKEQTIFFDTKYSYSYNLTDFQQFPATTTTTWSGGDSDFFWSTNYRGATGDTRLFFTTNFVVNAANAMRYYTGTGDWVDFAPLTSNVPISAVANTIYQARLILPYYGRLLLFNTYEGTTAGSYAGATNFFNRVRFSQIGNPIDADAFRVDIFGKGGFLDAPTNEEIVSADYFKNTLIVYFERSTWELRYVGEYGLPFIWERISTDFGSESTFSVVNFSDFSLSVGSTGITAATSVNVKRVDEQIPDTAFNFQNKEDGTLRVHGIRDYQRELVYWSYVDSQLSGKFPNKSLIYNYKNNTYANFRNNVTAYGTLQLQSDITWDSLTTSWDDMTVTWDDVDTQSEFPRIVCGNQQGFINFYGYVTEDEPTLTISDIDLTVSPNRLTVINHNLENSEVIYITDTLFNIAPTTSLNDRIYSVQVIDADTIDILTYDPDIDDYVVTDAQAARTYMGLGKITLFPLLYIQTKDFNPFQTQGKQMKLAYVDFLTDATPSSAISIKLFMNASQSIQGNLIVGNNSTETYLTSPYYPNSGPLTVDSEYAWHRFYATAAGQFLRIVMTYNNALMNTLATHQQDMELNAFNLWLRPGGKIMF